MALQECCLTKATGKMPALILSEIIALSGINIEEMRKRNLKKRLHQILDDLRYFEPEELTSLSQELSSMKLEKAI